MWSGLPGRRRRLRSRMRTGVRSHRIANKPHSWLHDRALSRTSHRTGHHHGSTVYTWSSSTSCSLLSGQRGRRSAAAAAHGSHRSNIWRCELDSHCHSKHTSHGPDVVDGWRPHRLNRSECSQEPESYRRHSRASVFPQQGAVSAQVNQEVKIHTEHRTQRTGLKAGDPDTEHTAGSQSVGGFWTSECCSPASLHLKSPTGNIGRIQVVVVWWERPVDWSGNEDLDEESFPSCSALRASVKNQQS